MQNDNMQNIIYYCISMLLSVHGGNTRCKKIVRNISVFVFVFFVNKNSSV